MLLSRSLLSSSPSPGLRDLTLVYNGYSGEVPSYEQGYSRARDLRVTSVKKLLCSFSVPLLRGLLWRCDAALNRLLGRGGAGSELYAGENDVTAAGNPVALVHVDERGLKEAAGEGWVYEAWQRKDKLVERHRGRGAWGRSRHGETGELEGGGKFVTLACPRGSVLWFAFTLVFPALAVFWYSLFLIFGGAFVVIGIQVYSRGSGKSAAIKIFR